MVRGSLGLGLVLGSVLWFNFLHFLLSFLPVPDAVRRHNDPFKVFRYRNLVVSLCHAAITGPWALFSFAIYGAEIWRDLLGFRNWMTYGVVCFSSGYFVYDTLDILLAHKMREKWDILVHHAVILGSAVYTVLAVNCIGYHTLAMLIEINTIFLHTRKLLQVGGVAGSSVLVRVNRWLNLGSFLLFRFVTVIILIRGLWRDAERLPGPFVAFFTVAVAILAAVNCILFWRLARADIRWFHASTDQFIRGHAKMDSMAGMCGSLTLFEDNPSYADLAHAPPTLLAMSNPNHVHRPRAKKD